jgi:hypothetical protein
MNFYVRFWPKADIPSCTAHVCFRVKRTSLFVAQMSAYDPKQTFGS